MNKDYYYYYYYYYCPLNLYLFILWILDFKTYIIIYYYLCTTKEFDEFRKIHSTLVCARVDLQFVILQCYSVNRSSSLISMRTQKTDMSQLDKS